MANRFRDFETACTPPDRYTGRRTAKCLRNFANSIGYPLVNFVVSDFFNDPEHPPSNIKEEIVNENREGPQ